jgi:hypothetical protein
MTVASDLVLPVYLLLIRCLKPGDPDAGKPLVTSPEVYVGNSGIAHARPEPGSAKQMSEHPVGVSVGRIS